MLFVVSLFHFNKFKVEWLFVEDWLRCGTLVLVGRHETKALVITQGLPLGGLMLGAEMSTARLLPLQGVAGHQFPKLYEVGYPESFLQLGVGL